MAVEASDYEEVMMNGINGTTGAYLTGPANAEALYKLITQEKEMKRVLAAEHYTNLRSRADRLLGQPYAVAPGIDAKLLSQTGWGVIVPYDAPPEVLESIQPLIDFRRMQVAPAKSGRPDYVQIFEKGRGFRPNDTMKSFLGRLQRAVGVPADPKKGVPYYLLLVASPQQIPWNFQYDLDVDYAVGRLWFDKIDGGPDLDAFRRYADSVVAAENRQLAEPKGLTFFATRHDSATTTSSEKLVTPLLAELDEWQSDTGNDWKITSSIGAEAKKARLTELLGGAETPSILFTASHGIGFEKEDQRQLRHQGALVCQDIGPISGLGPTAESSYFSGDDVPDNARVHGLLTFHFACFGGGTPTVDDFPDLTEKRFCNEVIAANPFVARLPQRLLSHPNGGALACVGHVDRVWTCSFLLAREEQVDIFSACLKQLLAGFPIGHAMEFFNNRYAALSAALTTQYEDVRFGRMPDAEFVASCVSTWLEHNDARNYVILGDPAVRVGIV